MICLALLIFDNSSHWSVLWWIEPSSLVSLCSPSPCPFVFVRPPPSLVSIHPFKPWDTFSNNCNWTMNCLFCLIILLDITSILIIEFWISDSHHHSFQPPSLHLVLLPSSFMWGSSLNPFYCLFILCSGMMPCLKTSHVQRCMVIHSWVVWWLQAHSTQAHSIMVLPSYCTHGHARWLYHISQLNLNGFTTLTIHA